MLSRPPAPTGADAPTPCPLLLGKSVVAAGGRSGGLPRPLRHPSGGRWVIHPSNGPGCGEGGAAGPEMDCHLPPPPPLPLQASWSLLEPVSVKFWGTLVSVSRKKWGRSENGLVWGSGVGGGLWLS